MEEKGKKNWWFLAINGIIAILIGFFLLFFEPNLMKVLVVYFGIAVIVIGVLFLMYAIRNLRKNKNAGMLLFESILTLVIGLILVLFPTFSLKFFLVILGVWAIILGIVQLVILYSIKRPFGSKKILAVNGILTILLGILLFFDPVTTAVILLKIMGVFGIVFGAIMIYFGLLLKSMKEVAES